MNKNLKTNDRIHLWCNTVFGALCDEPIKMLVLTNVTSLSQPE